MYSEDKYIEKAKEFLELAKLEFERAKRENNLKILQDACGKCWLAAIEATYAFLLKKGIKEEELPKTDRGRAYMISKYGDKELKLYYFSLRHRFHIDGYYDGLLSFDEFATELDDLKFYIEKIKLS
jgi:uncharacterized protein (UPF0332 family)